MRKATEIASGKSKVLFILSIAVLCYFLLMIISYNLRYDSPILGVIREAFTIPVLVGTLVLVFLSATAFKKENYRISSFAFYSLVTLTVTIFLLFSAS